MHFVQQFDIGSPLMCRSGLQGWRLRGILSRRGNCDLETNTRPDVFTRMETAQSWIENTIPALRSQTEEQR